MKRIRSITWLGVRLVLALVPILSGVGSLSAKAKVQDQTRLFGYSSNQSAVPVASAEAAEQDQTRLFGPNADICGTLCAQHMQTNTLSCKVKTPVAIGGDTSPIDDKEIRIMDGQTGTFTASADNDDSSVRSVAWNCCGTHLATGGDTVVDSILGSFEVQVWCYDGVALSPVAIATHGATVHSVAWSPNDKYLAIGGDTPTDGFEVRVFEFDGMSLSEIATFDHGATVQGVCWTPDGEHLGIVGAAGTGSFEIRVLKFDPIAMTLTVVDSVDHDGSDVNSCDWSPDGSVLAIGGVVAGGVHIRIYDFDGVSLTEIDSVDFGSTVNEVKWSPDGTFLAAVGEGSPQIRIYEFNGSSLALVTSEIHGAAVNSVDWYPDGTRLAIGGEASAINTHTLRKLFAATIAGATDRA